MAEVKLISKYLRDPRTNKRKGVVVAIGHDTAWTLGVSVTNTKAGDVFDANKGLSIALGRANKTAELWEANKDGKVVQTVTDDMKVIDYHPTIEVPVSVYDEVIEFSTRAAKYFKDKTAICSFEANTTKLNFEESVAELTKMFERSEKAGRNAVPPSLRGKKTQITLEDIQQLQRIAEALQVVGQENMTGKRVLKT